MPNEFLLYNRSELSYLDLSYVSLDTEIHSHPEVCTPSKNDDTNVDKEHPSRIDLATKVLAHSLKFKQSYKCLEQTADLINSTPGSLVKIPNTKYKIKKHHPLSLMPQFCIFCSQCKTYSMTSTANAECVMCSQILKRADSKYFVFLPLVPQLRKVIHKNFDSILAYEQKMHENSDKIRDVHDGIIYQRAKAKYPNSIILPLVGNTDGARIFNSTNKSIWPIQFYQCFLPPNVRYIPENIIVTAICEGKILIGIVLFFIQ